MIGRHRKTEDLVTFVVQMELLNGDRIISAGIETSRRELEQVKSELNQVLERPHLELEYGNGEVLRVPTDEIMTVDVVELT